MVYGKVNEPGSCFLEVSLFNTYAEQTSFKITLSMSSFFLFPISLKNLAYLGIEIISKKGNLI